MSGKIEISREQVQQWLDDMGSEKHEKSPSLARRREELRALLAAPVVERQEPIMHITPQVLGMLKGELRMQSGGITFSESKPIGNWTVPLYTSPPAPVADDLVRLLTRARIYARGEFRDEIDACLKELNK